MAMGHRHTEVGRPRLAAQLAGANVALLHARLGPPGLGEHMPYLSVLGQRYLGLQCQSIAGDAPRGRSQADAGRDRIRQALGLYREAQARGEDAVAEWALCGAVQGSPWLPADEAGMIVEEGLRVLGPRAAEPMADGFSGGALSLLVGLLGVGRLDDAAGCLEVLSGCGNSTPFLQHVWWALVGTVAQAQGDFVAASDSYERSLEIAQRHVYLYRVELCHRRLQECEARAPYGGCAQRAT